MEAWDVRLPSVHETSRKFVTMHESWHPVCHRVSFFVSKQYLVRFLVILVIFPSYSWSNFCCTPPSLKGNYLDTYIVT